MNTLDHDHQTTTATLALTLRGRARRAAAVAAILAVIAGIAPADAAPAGGGLDVVPAEHVELAWDGVAGATAYEVSRDGETIATTTGTSYTDPFAAVGETVLYAVHAVTDTGRTVVDEALEVVPQDLDPPALGGTLEVAGVHGDHVRVRYDIAWYDRDTVSFHLAVDGQLVHELPQAELSGELSLAGLAEDAFRTIEIVAEDVFGNLTLSGNALSVTEFLDDVVLPWLPIDLEARVCGDTATLRWGTPHGTSGSAEVSWKVYRGGRLLGTTSEPRFVDPAVPVTGGNYAVRPVHASGAIGHSARLHDVRPSPAGLCRLTAAISNGSAEETVDVAVDVVATTVDGATNATIDIVGPYAPRIDDRGRIAAVQVFADGQLVDTFGPDYYAGPDYNVNEVRAGLTFDGALPALEVETLFVDGTSARQPVTSVDASALRAPPATISSTTYEAGTVRWAYDGTATSFDVLRDGVVVATVAGDARSHAIAPVQPGQLVVIRVVPVEPGGRRAPASPVLVRG